MRADSNNIYSVSKLNAESAALLAEHFGFICVIGEISNLSRLGVIKGIPIHYVYSEPIRVKGKNSQYYSHEIDEDQTIDLDISVEADGENFILTELGELFIKACTEKIN